MATTKEVVAMLCVTMLGALTLWKYGDGNVLTSVITIIGILAGYSLGRKAKSKED